MQGKIFKRRILLVWVVTILAIPGQSVALSDADIAIVKSSDNSYYNQTIQTLLNRADVAARFNIIDIESETDLISRLANSDLIIALGTQATSIVSDRLPNNTLISAYLTAQQAGNYNPASQRHLAVLLDQPLKRYLAFCHALLDRKKIGLINYEELKIDSSLQRFLLKHDLELNQYQVNETDNVLTSLRQLIRQNSSLLMLPDQRIYNRNSLKGVLLTTYRSRLPVISYSPAHVKSGALASIFSSPENIGEHLGDLLNRFIKANSLPSEDRVFAKYYSISINHQVARALGLSLPDEDQLRQQLKVVLQ